MMKPIQTHHLYPSHQPSSTSQQTISSRSSFQNVLANEVQAHDRLKISKHAAKRLSERNIQISEAGWHKINEKVNEARTKGISDSLVMTHQAALVVSVKNDTVITAMGRDETDAHIFTNIDGAIMIDQ
ncbi:TIGR02530 family flagellar biosynthesis protein [Tuberibacillus sp. Marseille-P3662]|uniref:TIGR02530 family flagellar biosynthesis protein n=1 Tax=Tuberibacillus sp. Marseille-P3662 TaxID=1965358 RepID=UPI000A1C9166|nr:TIGR02530 family flagellar biosynthesis protein [Tuberibacillus sp. Marseille-P3662]